ncbi:hypothetical protein TNIN_177981 [Trichonephila inaurata madagascariensis]|uniref:Uncharacterized protein n=1 Tax=Trichonephila inaurata madagascariensis TaxID=2747483 RepID=A0A8X6XZQ5_9ARAC|nr:hypothetical protein TNIN_177981 [Trichonephila inaurata madagascariensis]
MKKEIQIEEYKIVRSLLVETDETAFDLRLKEEMKIFDKKYDTKEFNFEQTNNLTEINSAFQGNEKLSIHSCITDEEEIIIFEKPRVLES